MKIFWSLIFILFSTCLVGKDVKEIYVDKQGVMRWKDTDKEASFYGVNYTLPFAYAYRAMEYTGQDHKESIDKDVYHFSRLGFNAYRIHIWDVEISDANGNLIENEHLNLLDYLIAKLKEHNIHVLVTTMTNFGNGYPERDINTGAFSYNYEKCKIHDEKEAIEAQTNYVAQLLNHINPYTGQAYKDDNTIVAFEINNEPCHSGTPQQTENYINEMLQAMAHTGNQKPIFYNVSHNMDHVQAYYNTNIAGTTYQWYPTGLVSGHTRKGNFLPYVDNYNIPFSNAAGFDTKAKAIYEFDPADITYSHVYPAIARTFRNKGFQWITQFAYDPIDIAATNSEYQTHFLNLAYTPQKAVSMAIAAEVAYNIPRYKQFDKYPNDTVFDEFSVSYIHDNSEFNSPQKFYYSNTTNSTPHHADSLHHVIGYGNSPVIHYEGTGAYFLDKINDKVWRLELMPDAVQISDPFSKPSLNKEVVSIAWNKWNMSIDLPGLGKDFYVTGIDEGNKYRTQAQNNTFGITPGTYLLSSESNPGINVSEQIATLNNIKLNEFVAPKASIEDYKVIHTPLAFVEIGNDFEINAQIVGPTIPDSVIVYTDKISFWRKNNPYIKMDRTGGYNYSTKIPTQYLTEGICAYNIVICQGNEFYTFPSGTKGHPLDWDFTQNNYWKTRAVAPQKPIELFRVNDLYSDLDSYVIPEQLSFIVRTLEIMPNQPDVLNFSFGGDTKDCSFIWRKYIKDDIAARKNKLKTSSSLCFSIVNAKNMPQLKVGFVTTDGFTYTAPLQLLPGTNDYKIPLADLKQDITTLVPAPYPVFLDRYFEPDTTIPFRIENIEILEISTNGKISTASEFGIRNIWIE